MTIMQLTVTEIRAPLGLGPGTVFARSINDQQVKIVVNGADWASFANAKLGVGDSAMYDAERRTWRRA
jgi:hypothetical protein